MRMTDSAGKESGDSHRGNRASQYDAATPTTAPVQEITRASTSGIEGTLQDFETLAGDLLDAQEDAVAMERTERDRLEDEHLEGPRREFNRFRQKLSPTWERRVYSVSFPVKETAPGDRVFAKG
jgi:hypothetical protein